jgi:hypothetical protein
MDEDGEEMIVHVKPPFCRPTYLTKSASLHGPAVPFALIEPEPRLNGITIRITLSFKQISSGSQSGKHGIYLWKGPYLRLFRNALQSAGGARLSFMCVECSPDLFMRYRQRGTRMAHGLRWLLTRA